MPRDGLCPSVAARSSSPRNLSGAIARFNRAIQYSVMPRSITFASGYWMPRLKRGLTAAEFLQNQTRSAPDKRAGAERPGPSRASLVLAAVTKQIFPRWDIRLTLADSRIL